MKRLERGRKQGISLDGIKKSIAVLEGIGCRRTHEKTDFFSH